MNVAPFVPSGTASVAVTVASGSVALAGAGNSVELQNDGTVTVFVKLGGSAVTAAVTDYPILAGASKIIGRDPGQQTYVAAITASGTATLYATAGEGK